MQAGFNQLLTTAVLKQEIGRPDKRIFNASLKDFHVELNKPAGQRLSGAVHAFH